MLFLESCEKSFSIWNLSKQVVFLPSPCLVQKYTEQVEQYQMVLEILIHSLIRVTAVHNTHIVEDTSWPLCNIRFTTLLFALMLFLSNIHPFFFLASFEVSCPSFLFILPAFSHLRGLTVVVNTASFRFGPVIQVVIQPNPVYH